MSERKRSAATATFGLSGVAAAGALRHAALVDSYEERGPRPIPRPKPPYPSELRMLKHPRGRGKWAAGAALSAIAIPPAATGTAGLLRGRQVQKRSFVAEGYAGTRDSLLERNQTFKERAPKKLVAGNYLAGAAIGSGAGALVHHTLGRTKVPGGARSAMASAAGVLAGSATLPLQSKLTSRASKGKYVVTPTGVRRALEPEAVQKVAVRVHGPSVRAGYGKLPSTRVGRLSNEVGARVGGKWAHHIGNLANAVEGYEPKHRAPAKAKTVKLIATGRSKAGEALRTISYDASGINDKDKLIRDTTSGAGRLAMAKRDDIGAGMSRAERRARVTAAGAPMVVGDFLAAGQAARLSPEKYRTRSAVQQYAGGQAGGLAGSAAGAAAALSAAKASPKFSRSAQSASDTIDRGKQAMRSAVGMKSGPSLGSRMVNHPKTPSMLRAGAQRFAQSGAGRAIAHNPKVAGIGALVGGAIGGQAAQQAAYGHIMTRDDRYRRQSQAAHGSSVRKQAPPPLTAREKRTLSRRKEHSAAMSVIGGTAGLTALGATVGERALKVRRPDIAARLARVQVPALTTGGGIGGINAYTNAAIQHREAQRTLSKGLIATGVRRAPAMRRGFIRQTRTATGVKVSTVQGGLIR